jgi:hypothetical protein
VQEGFNATIIAHGQSGTGKSRSLFTDAIRGGSDDGVMGAIMKVVLNSHTALYSVGISAWEIFGNKTIDLLAPPSRSSSSSGSQITSVAVEDLGEASAVIRLARSRSVNWSVSQGASLPLPLPNRAHAFYRFVVYNVSKKEVSTLHVVDLVGTAAPCPPPSMAGGFSNRSNLMVRESERIDANVQLHAFSRVISELAAVHDPGHTTAKTKSIPSARNRSVGIFVLISRTHYHVQKSYIELLYLYCRYHQKQFDCSTCSLDIRKFENLPPVHCVLQSA